MSVTYTVLVVVMINITKKLAAFCPLRRVINATIFQKNRYLLYLTDCKEN